MTWIKSAMNLLCRSIMIIKGECTATSTVWLISSCAIRPYETTNRALFFPTPVVHQHQHQHHTHVHTHSNHSHTKHSHSHHLQAPANISHAISLPQALVYHRPHLPAPVMHHSSPAYRLHTSQAPLPTMHPNFQYSKCTGRKKALCVSCCR